MARNGDESNQLDEHSKMILRVRELFHGRFTIEEIEKLLSLHAYEQGPTVFYILSSDTQEIRKVLTDSTNVVDRLTYIRNDDKLVEDAKSNLIGLGVRQFTCCRCDRMWWWKAPKRKPVSRCRFCHVKYDPVPEEVEFGWGEFLCKKCGNIFKGHGQKTTTRSECYHCHELCFPVKIEPPVLKSNVRGRGAKNHHSCDAPDCYNRIAGSSNDKNVRGPSGLLKKCVHPLSKHGEKKASTYYPCDIHTSTGSTVETFLSQDFLSCSRSDYSHSLGAINEDLDGIPQNMNKLSVADKCDKGLLKTNRNSLSITLPSQPCPLPVRSLKNTKESVGNVHLQFRAKDEINEADGAPN